MYIGFSPSLPSSLAAFVLSVLTVGGVLALSLGNREPSTCLNSRFSELVRGRAPGGGVGEWRGGLRMVRSVALLLFF